jgi:hypothetical protein
MEDAAETEQLEVAAILCDISRLVRSRHRRRQRARAAAPHLEILSWGRRRPRSMPEVKPSPAPAPAAAERGGAASPDTPLAYPESGGDDAPPEDKGEVAVAPPLDQVSRPPAHARDLPARLSRRRRRGSSIVASLSDFF